MGLESKNTLSIGTRPFREAQSKAMRAFAQSGQYHTIVESRVHLTLGTHVIHDIVLSTLNLNV